MQLAIIFGLILFAVFALGILLLLGRSSAQGALLEEVTRDMRGGAGGLPHCGVPQSAATHLPSPSQRSGDSSRPSPILTLCVGSCLPAIASRTTLTFL